ncbi:MAG: DNA-binding protein [Vicinamibacterales bacterium]
MSQLVVRNVPPRVVKALKQRAARAGRSAEAEHRAILESALAAGMSSRDFKAFLRAMPEPGPIRVRRSRDTGRPVAL